MCNEIKNYNKFQYMTVNNNLKLECDKERAESFAKEYPFLVCGSFLGLDSNRQSDIICYVFNTMKTEQLRQSTEDMNRNFSEEVISSDSITI